MAKISEPVGTSHPSSTRIEAMKLCQVLLVSCIHFVCIVAFFLIKIIIALPSAEIFERL
jgi:hypothetical protein